MSFSSVPRVAASAFKFLIGRREKSFIANRVVAQQVARERFCAVLRYPYPNQTDSFVARQWAPTLGTTPRTIENWLAHITSPKIEEAYVACACLGVWATMEIFTEDKTRNEILKEMSSR